MSTSSRHSRVDRDGLAWQLLQEMTEAVFLFDSESLMILEVNPAGEGLLSRDRDELVGCPLVQAFEPADVDRLTGLLLNCDNPTDVSVITDCREPLQLTTSGGVRRFVTFSIRRLNADGQPIGMFTARLAYPHQRTSGKFLPSDVLPTIDELLTHTLQLAGLASFLCSGSSGDLVCSDSLFALFELPGSDAVTFDSLVARIHPEDREELHNQWSRMQSHGEPFESKLRLCRLDSELRHICWIASVHSRAVADASRGGILVVIRDDTEQVRLRELETEHQVSLAKLEDVFQALQGFAWEYDLKASAYSFVHERIQDILGYPPAAVLDDPDFFSRVLHPEDRDSIAIYDTGETVQGSDHTMTYRMIAADGSTRWVRDIVNLTRDSDGTVTHQRGLILDITDSRRLRDELTQTEERFRRMFDESPIGLMEMDWSDVRKQIRNIRHSGVSDLAAWLEENPDEAMKLTQLARITAVNRGGLEMFQASGIADFGGNIGTLMQEDSLATFNEYLLFRIRGGGTFEAENVAYTVSGQRIFIQLHVTSAADTEESWNRVYASISDITDRKHAQLLRDGHRQTLEMLASSTTVESVLCTLTAELELQSPYLRAAVFRTTSSSSALQLMAGGSTAQELVTLIDSVRIGALFGGTDDFFDIPLTPSARDRFDGKQERTPPEVIELISRAAGLCGYEHGLLKPAIDADGHLLGLLAVFRCESSRITKHENEAIVTFTDLTALVLKHDQQRRDLIARTDELQSVFETYPDALVRISSDGTILDRYSGDRLSEMLNLSQVPTEQILWHLFPWKAARRVRAAIENVDAGSPQETVEFTIEHDHARQEFEGRFLQLPASTEQIAVLRDVTQLKQAELALKHASERFRYLFDHSPDAIFVESLDGVVLDANHAACELHMMAREQLLGASVFDLVPGVDRHLAALRSQSLISGEMSDFESRSLRGDGSIVPVGVRISRITFDGAPAVLLHVRNITQQKQEEERKREQERQLAHVARLTMMGQLVAGIAHEIRQPLWALSTFADVCVEALNRPDCHQRLPHIRKIAEKLVAEARRANGITTRMFSFARKGKPERTACDISEIVSDAVELTAGNARSSRIRTVMSFETPLPPILCDRVLIEQIFVNLLNNAYTALSTHTSNARQVSIDVTMDAANDEYMTVTVRDNGPGLAEGVLPEQLFEGFFTTGQSGLGIGLALSRSFVEDHGGAIRAEPLPGGGLELCFSLRIDGGHHPDAK
ncbi:MAG: PAS domain S-box protein [Planctomycetota bacterium]|nr:PAS domain S-box protein [Planctomycetota bacterium]